MPPAPVYRLTDETGTLAAESRQVIEKVLAENASQTGVELIVLLTHTAGPAGARAHAIAKRQELSHDYNNSIILVVALADRHAEVATAPKFADVFTAQATNTILTDRLVPFMRQGNTVGGILAGVDGLRDLLRYPLRPTLDWGTLRRWHVIVFVIAFVVFTSLVVTDCRAKRLCPGCGKMGKLRSIVVQPATYTTEGLRRFTLTCVPCQLTNSWDRVIPVKSDSDSGSSGGSSSSGSSDGGGGASW